MNRLSALLFTTALALAGTTPTLAAPALLGTLPLDAVPIQVRAAADGRSLVLLTPRTGQRAPGVQVVDVSNPSQLRPAGFLPLADEPTALTLTADGKQALVAVDVQKPQYGKATARRVIAVDLSDPARPRERWRRTFDARALTLGESALVFAWSQPAGKDKRGNEKWESVVATGLEGRNQVRIEEEGYGGLGSVWLSPSGAYMANARAGQIAIWDLRTTPVRKFEQDSTGAVDRYPGCAVMLDSGFLAIGDARLPRVGVYRAAAGVPRVAVAAVKGSLGACQTLNGQGVDGRLLFDSRNNSLQVLDISDPLRPSASMLAIPPQRALAVAAGLLFTGSYKEPVLRVHQINGATPPVNWDALAATHKTALAIYGRKKDSWKAAEAFLQAGVIDAMEQAPQGISDKQAAAIFNDFGFFSQYRHEPDLAERALRRTIALDPARTVAYLNLATLLRDQLRALPTDTEREVRRSEAGKHYRHYLELGGAPVASMEAFLAPEPEGEACTAIAMLANEGRLDVALRNMATDIPYNGRRADFYFTTQGIAQVPYVFIFDSATDAPIEDKRLQELSEDGWDGDMLSLLTLRGRHYVLGYRDERHPQFAYAVADGKVCRFTTTTVETPGPKASETELCALVQAGKTPARLKFKGRSAIEDAEAFWPLSEIRGVRKLDFANDGKPQNVAELLYSSGAGPGCDAVFFDTLDGKAAAQAEGPRRKLLLQLQDIGSEGPSWESCANNPGFFEYDKRIWFETRPREWPPTRKADEYHRIRILEKGKVREVCDFRFGSTVEGKPARSGSK